MKRAITALGICTLLACVAAASAPSTLEAFTWDGSASTAWDNGHNWDPNNTSTSYPGEEETGCDDDATINDTSTNVPALPAFDIFLNSLTMGAGSTGPSLDASGQTLYVNGTASFNSTDNSGDAGTFITLNNSSNGTNGSVIGETIVIYGGDDGTLLKVTTTGTKEMTLQCGEVTCPTS